MHDKFVLTKEDYNREMDRAEASFGMYPEPYRHLQSYNQYKKVYPEALIQDYMEKMNEPCTLFDFKEIYKASIKH